MLEERITVMRLVRDVMKQDVAAKQLVHGILLQKLVNLNVMLLIVPNVIQIQIHVRYVKPDII